VEVEAGVEEAVAGEEEEAVEGEEDLGRQSSNITIYGSLYSVLVYGLHS
jgi:hypothetical protein